MAERFRLPVEALLDTNVIALAGGSITFYLTETTTLETIYTDDDLTIPANNPYTLDAVGQHGDIFLGGVDYRVIVKNAAGSIVPGGDIDPVHGSAIVVSGELVSFGIIANMTFLTKDTLADGQQVMVGGYATIGDGGGGLFYWDEASTATIDGGTVFFADEGGTGRWKRIFSGAVNPKWFGAKGDGIAGDTTALQAAINHACKLVEIPDGTYVFTTLTVPASTTIVGNGQDKTILQTVTTGNAVTLSGHYITFQDFKIYHSGGQTGKGIVADDKYWFRTERLWVDGFDYDTYFSKSIYHSHYDSRFTGANYGVHYYGASGSWNVDWYNNQISLVNVIANGNDTVGFYLKGMGLAANGLDVSGCATGIQLVGDSVFPAHAITISGLYSETTDTVIDASYTRFTVVDAFVQGGPNSGARFNTPFQLSNSTLIISGHIWGLDYWDYTYVLTNSSRLESSQTIASGADFTTTSKDATSEAYINDYEEGSFTGTLTGCTTSPTGTIKFTRDGDQVSLYVAADITGTSNTTAATITGIPAGLQPGNSQRFNCLVKDNTVNVAGYALVAAGTMTLYTSAAFGSTSFTGSGTKGLIGEQVLTFTRK